MGTRTKNQIVLKKQKCGGFLFKIFEPKKSIRSTNVALAGNVLRLSAGCYVVWLLNCPALFVSRTVAENRMLAAANFKL